MRGLAPRLCHPHLSSGRKRLRKPSGGRPFSPTGFSQVSASCQRAPSRDNTVRGERGLGGFQATTDQELVCLPFFRGAVVPASWGTHTHTHPRLDPSSGQYCFLFGTTSQRQKERGKDEATARSRRERGGRRLECSLLSTLPSHARLPNFLLFLEKIQTLFAQTGKQKAGPLLDLSPQWRQTSESQVRGASPQETVASTPGWQLCLKK